MLYICCMSHFPSPSFTVEESVGSCLSFLECRRSCAQQPATTNSRSSESSLLALIRWKAREKWLIRLVHPSSAFPILFGGVAVDAFSKRQWSKDRVTTAALWGITIVYKRDNPRQIKKVNFKKEWWLKARYFGEFTCCNNNFLCNQVDCSITVVMLCRRCLRRRLISLHYISKNSNNNNNSQRCFRIILIIVICP